MYKQVICPTDFSNSANNAVEYAANFCKATGASLKLYNAQILIPGPIPPGVMLEGDVKIAKDILKKTSEDVEATFGVSCTYEVDVTRQTMSDALLEAAGKNSLLVMGTNGADNLFEYFFGSSTYTVVRKAKCPVLVVPENTPFSPVEKIVFAWDYSLRNELSFGDMQNVFAIPGVKIVMLHISRRATDISDDVYKAFQDKVIRMMDGKEDQLVFERLVSNDITNTISSYMNQSGASLLVLTHYDHDWATNLFRQSVIKNMTTMAAYPTLILHE